MLTPATVVSPLALEELSAVFRRRSKVSRAPAIVRLLGSLKYRTARSAFERPRSTTRRRSVSAYICSRFVSVSTELCHGVAPTHAKEDGAPCECRKTPGSRPPQLYARRRWCRRARAPCGRWYQRRQGNHQLHQIYVRARHSVPGSFSTILKLPMGIVNFVNVFTVRPVQMNKFTPLAQLVLPPPPPPC